MNAALRALFPITESAVYLNHAAVSPPPETAIEAAIGQIRDVALNGSVNYRRWIAVRERARSSLAGLLGARPEQVAFTRNTSDSIATVANGLRWRPGDNIVTFRHEFPANVYPWLRIRDTAAVEVRWCDERNARIDLDEFTGLIDASTRVVAISHVQFGSGYRADLERIGRAARAVDALFVVDMIQNIGALPVDVESELVDAAAGACHKWLLTPEGVGWLYLSDRARARVEPTLVGWTSVVAPEDYARFDQELKPGTLPWETGTAPVALIHALDASLRLLTDTGIERIAGHLYELTDYLCDRLAARRYDVASSRREREKSQIVCLNPPAGWTSMSLYTHLRKHNVITAPRGERLRIAPHLYNVKEDIDALLEALPFLPE